MIIAIAWGIILGLLCVSLIAVAVGIGVDDEPDKPHGWTSPLKGEFPKDRLKAYREAMSEWGYTTYGPSREEVANRFKITTKQAERNYLDRLVKAHGQEAGLEMFLKHRNEVIDRKQEAADHKAMVDALYTVIDEQNAARR